VNIGPNLISNDLFPRSKQYLKDFAVTTIESGASTAGGDNYPSWHHDLESINGSRWCLGDHVSARLSGSLCQYGNYYAQPWVQR
jgi:hypothetical protein